MTRRSRNRPLASRPPALDEAARLAQYEWLVRQEVGRYVARRLVYPSQRADALQEARIGVLYALRTYDPARGRVPEKTYVQLCARARVRRWIERGCSPVRLPGRLSPDRMYGGTCRAAALREWTRARRLTTLQAVVPDHRASHAYDRAATRALLAGWLRRLPWRDRFLLIYRYGLFGCPAHSLRVLGAALGGLTHQRATQLLQAALRRLAAVARGADLGEGRVMRLREYAVRRHCLAARAWIERQYGALPAALRPFTVEG